jgi:hypothetical protein
VDCTSLAAEVSANIIASVPTTIDFPFGWVASDVHPLSITENKHIPFPICQIEDLCFVGGGVLVHFSKQLAFLSA